MQAENYSDESKQNFFTQKAIADSLVNRAYFDSKYLTLPCTMGLLKKWGKKIDKSLGSPSHLKSSIPAKRKAAERRFITGAAAAAVSYAGNQQGGAQWKPYVKPDQSGVRVNIPL